MSKNYLIEGKARAVPDVLCSNGSSLSVRQDTHLLLTAVPMHSRATFVELPCGCLASPEGWVTHALSTITRGRHRTTYYKLLECGSVRTLRLTRALFEVVNSALLMEALNLAIDDTLIPRQSEKVPGSIVWPTMPESTTGYSFC